MPKLSGRVHRFAAELSRRKVVRVVVAYAVAALTIIQSADPIANALDMPTPTLYWIVVALLAGLPVAALLAWAYDIVPDRGTPPPGSDGDAPERRAAAVDEESDTTPRPPAAGVPAYPAAALPAATTTFIGRDAELRELGGLLADTEVRLITLAGPGGSGKTRLAIAAARDHAAAAGIDAAFVAVGTLATPELLVQALTHALGVPLSSGSEPLEALTDLLRDKTVLLVIDNFDELTAAAGVLDTILRSAPGVRLLVTSRERLNLLEETLLPVEGLAVVAPDSNGDSDAIRLFAAAARRHDHRFRLDARTRPHVQRICSLVSGMPLALELAAAWVRVLSCGEIAAELTRGIDILSISTSLADRHRSLRATFDASWRLLGDEEQRAAARLAVFRSGFDRSAAEAVAGATPAVLRTLLDKSLLSRQADRFVMLDTVRQYGLERLGDDPASARDARTRHMRYFGGRLTELEHGAVRWDPQALADIAAVIDDARAAWENAVEQADVETITGCMEPLFHFYDARGWGGEGVDRFSRASSALALADDASADVQAARMRARARLDMCGGALLGRMGRHDEANALLRRGLDGIEGTAGGSADTDAVIFALHRLGTNCFDQGNYDEASHVWEWAATLADATGRRHVIGWSQAHLGSIAFAHGQYAKAADLFRTALDLLRTEGDRNGIWVATNNLGVLAALRKEHDQAQFRFQQALAVQRELGNRRAVAVLLHNLGSAAALAGDYEAARIHLEEGIAVSTQIGYVNMTAASLASLGDALIRAGHLDEARPILRRSLGMAATANNQPTVLSGLIAYARLCFHDGEVDRAARLAAAVASHPAGDEDIRERALLLLHETGHPGLAPAGNGLASPDDADAAALIDGPVPAASTGSGQYHTDLRGLIDDIIMEQPHVP